MQTEVDSDPRLCPDNMPENKTAATAVPAIAETTSTLLDAGRNDLLHAIVFETELALTTHRIQGLRPEQQPGDCAPRKKQDHRYSY
jgi:hypothetical protein